MARPSNPREHEVGGGGSVTGETILNKQEVVEVVSASFSEKRLPERPFGSKKLGRGLVLWHFFVLFFLC